MHSEHLGKNADDAGNDGHLRDLAQSVLNYTGGRVFDELLMPWIDAHPADLAWLAAFARRTGTPVPSATQEELSRLYALSRLCELLRQAVWPLGAGVRQTLLALTEEEFDIFLERLGIDVHVPAVYSPFHHEVVQVLAAADPRRAPLLVSSAWPCLTLGRMLLMRAGAVVEAGADVLRAGIADAATLYWTYDRAPRPTHDLAHGWGSNSAWRTPFRRDYAIDGMVHLNVDGTIDLANVDPAFRDEQGLTQGERIELLVHRSFVTATRPHVDLYPYADRLAFPIEVDAGSNAPRWWQRLFR